MKIVYPNSKKIQTSMQIGVWENKVPVFDVKDMYGLNQLVGYVKLINAETGTVLFRGQSKLLQGKMQAKQHMLLFLLSC